MPGFLLSDGVDAGEYALKFAKTMVNGSPWPRITVVTPNYNYAGYVEETISSVVSQGYPNLEYIVIDDGSTDDSYDKILRYQPFLAHCEQHKNIGQAPTINKGFAMSTGEIMAWLNSDDKYMPWTFAVIAEIFEAFPDVDWVTGIPTLWDANGRHVHLERNLYFNKYDYGLGRYAWIQQESVFWRRSLWDRVGAYIDDTFKLQIDCELWTRFFKHADLWHINCSLGGYRYHPAARSVNKMEESHREAKKAITEMLRTCDKDTLHDLKILDMLRRLQPLGKIINLDGIISNFYPELFQRLSYKVITWGGQPEKWSKNTITFRITQLT